MDDLSATTHEEFASVRTRLEHALGEQGFGVLTRIDLRATLHEKLGVDHERHEILGVCNPSLAKEALDVDRDIALLLPCSVTIREAGDTTEVRVLDPVDAFTLADASSRTELEPLARAVRERLIAVLDETVPDRSQR